METSMFAWPTVQNQLGIHEKRLDNGGLYLHNWVGSAHFLSIWIENTFIMVCYFSVDDIKYTRIYRNIMVHNWKWQ